MRIQTSSREGMKEEEEKVTKNMCIRTEFTEWWTKNTPTILVRQTILKWICTLADTNRHTPISHIAIEFRTIYKWKSRETNPYVYIYTTYMYTKPNYTDEWMNKKKHANKNTSNTQTEHLCMHTYIDKSGLVWTRQCYKQMK